MGLLQFALCSASAGNSRFPRGKMCILIRGKLFLFLCMTIANILKLDGGIINIADIVSSYHPPRQQSTVISLCTSHWLSFHVYFSRISNGVYEAKLKFMPEYKHNSDSVKSVRTEIPKSGLNTGKGNIFKH